MATPVDLRTPAQQADSVVHARPGEAAAPPLPHVARPAAVADGLSRHALLSAQDSLRLGRTRRGRHLAQRALVRCAADDLATQAGAALVLGQAYVLESRFGLAQAAAARAQLLFAALADAAGQAEALAVLSYSSSALGLDDQAARAAREGLALRAAIASPLGQARGLNYLGVAAFWARDFGTARGVLEASIWFTNRAGQPAVGFHPLVNLCFGEVLRIVECERRGEGVGDLPELQALVARARSMMADGQVACIDHGTLEIGFMLLDFACCFIASRWGHTEAADAFYLACLERSRRVPANSWLHAVLWWARAERAVGEGDIDKSTASLVAMGEAARRGEHAQLQALAATLESAMGPALNQWDSRN